MCLRGRLNPYVSLNGKRKVVGQGQGGDRHGKEHDVRKG